MWWDLLPSEFEPRSTTKGEIFWALHQPFLAESGYNLRAKYEPGSKPPQWKTRGDMVCSEDHTPYPHNGIMDATRASNERLLTLKAISKSRHPYEVTIGRFLSSPPMDSHPKNHCVPVFDVLQSPLDNDIEIIVMPRLRSFDSPAFDTVGEFLDCFRQIFEGIEFMHTHMVAHRDCTSINIMLDASELYPEGFSPVNPWLVPNHSGLEKAKHITRIQCWPRYYLIDFGISRRYDPSNVPPMEPPISGGDKHPPEHSIITVNPPWVDSCNPFPTDVYYLGSMLKRIFSVGTFRPLKFLSPLADDMIRWDPNLRPTIGEVVQRFAELCNKRTKSELHQPGCPKQNTVSQRLRRLKYILCRVPPLLSVPFITDTTIDPSLRPFYSLTLDRLAAINFLETP
ncbi:hypothetical protein EV421DRAFT_1757217 [Armillaria borealis]|uniref:Protein kinase domain-containing protein n=1 Tax=Armillaria borealis TaxID=47425 RepID=A0AA39K4R4_9AGAR|nr:hypothetical protein EV421DRAFT_1757217 [Armillaria borealis]